MEIKVNAPAKVNLAVDVLGRRPDGYHSVSLVLQAISLSDTITITTTDTKEITVTCNDSNVPTDKTNIVYKSAERFFRYTKVENEGINIDIHKVVPSQAGLGGGSSDGAATVMGLNKLYNTRLKKFVLILEQMCHSLLMVVLNLQQVSVQIWRNFILCLNVQ